MKDSELLKLAKERIKSGKQIYICYALAEVLVKEYAPMKLPDSDITQLRKLRNWIYSMLDKNCFYEGWYRHKFNKEASKRTRKNGRLAWLDWMIAYCEKEEAGMK